MYTIMHGLLDFPCGAGFAAPTRIGLRGHTLKLHQQWCKTCRRQHAFSVRVVPYWNKLPEDIVTATSVETFKFRLDAQWQSLFQKLPSNPPPIFPPIFVPLGRIPPYAIGVIILGRL